MLVFGDVSVPIPSESQPEKLLGLTLEKATFAEENKSVLLKPLKICPLTLKDTKN